VLYQVAKTRKTSLLKSIMEEREEMTSTLIFTRTKYKAKGLALQLQKAGYSATSLQGNLSQQKRQQAMDGFRDGTFKILVATDIAARGIDVLGISHVINYDVPDTAETYTHRTGRTGRATRSGYALTFADREDSKMISLIERNLGKKMNREVVPSGFASMQEDEEVVREKRENFSQPMPRGKKPAAATHGKSRRSKACSFDFGTSKPVRR
jgi:superfamily II DNA/RNA helicase